MWAPVLTEAVYFSCENVFLTTLTMGWGNQRHYLYKCEDVDSVSHGVGICITTDAMPSFGNP